MLKHPSSEDMVIPSRSHRKRRQATPSLLPGSQVWVKDQVRPLSFCRFKDGRLTRNTGVGSILGTLINGWLVSAFGPKKVVFCTLCVMTCFLFIVFFAPNKEVLLVGEILLGLEWGIVSLSFSCQVLALTNLPVCDHCSGICLGSSSTPASRLLYLLDQHVLHHRAVHVRWCPPMSCFSTRSVGLSHSFCHSVVLALIPDSSRLVRT